MLYNTASYIVNKGILLKFEQNFENEFNNKTYCFFIFINYYSFGGKQKKHMETMTFIDDTKF